PWPSLRSTMTGCNVSLLGAEPEEVLHPVMVLRKEGHGVQTLRHPVFMVELSETSLKGFLPHLGSRLRSLDELDTQPDRKVVDAFVETASAPQTPSEFEGGTHERPPHQPDVSPFMKGATDLAGWSGSREAGV